MATWVYFLCRPAARFSQSTRFCRIIASQFRVAFPRLRAGTFIEAFDIFVSKPDTITDFPALGRGLSLRHPNTQPTPKGHHQFPRLRAGTFIEATAEGHEYITVALGEFPRLRAGTFIEADLKLLKFMSGFSFPRLRAGTFIEAGNRQSIRG